MNYLDANNGVNCGTCKNSRKNNKSGKPCYKNKKCGAFTLWSPVKKEGE